MTDHQAGGGIGRALSRLLGDTVIHAAGATSDHTQAARIRANSAFMDAAESHYAPILRDLFGDLMQRDDLPDQWRLLFTHMTEPGAQFDVLLQFIGMLSAAFTALFTMGSIELQPLVNQLRSDYQSVPLTPADLADMVERNIVGQDWAEGEAAKSGISAERFALMVKDTGEPYGVDQALSLLRRGLISEQRFAEVLYYSRVRNEFLPDVLQLAHETMTAGDAVELALKQITDEGAARDLFVRAGGLADQFDLLVQASGNPIGPEAAVHLWQHGEIDDEQLRQVIAHSRINPMFYDLAKLTGLKWLSVIQVELALKAGTVPPAEAAKWLAQDGYPTDQIEAFVTAAAAGKTATHKALTESQITELYETGVLTHDQAGAELVALGYEAGEVDFILAVYQQRRLLSMSQAAVAQVRKVYLAGRIDKSTASTDLDALGIDPAARDHYLTIWGIERATELRELSMAQIGSAFKKGLLSDTDALARWEAMGYSADDAAIILALYGGPPPAGSPAAAASATAGG